MWWSYILFVFECFGLYGNYLVGKGQWVGWLILLCHNTPWFIYAIATQQWGFLLLPIMWTSMYAFNMLKWKREQERKDDYD